jgi:hypothetical protein
MTTSNYIGVVILYLKSFLIFLLLTINIFCVSGQNLVNNGGFEESNSEYVTYVGYHPLSGSYYRIDSFTDKWTDFYHDKIFTKYHHIEKDTIFNGVVEEKLPLPFLGKAFAWIRYSYVIFDTINNKYDTIGNKPIIRSYFYNNKKYFKFYGYNGEHSAFSQKLKNCLTTDSSYVLSYRQKYGSEIYNENKFYYNANGDFFTNINKHGNIMTGLGVLFSTKNISGKGQTVVYPETYSDIIRPEFQDTIFDTSYKWRLIEREFIADSNFEYIAFGQFINEKNKLKYFANYPNFTIANLSEIQKTYYFPYFVDNVRLLPRKQYLKVTPDLLLCKEDTVVLEVFRGTGPYEWRRASIPSIILSSTSELKIKVDTTTLFQVMSPYDTASIMVYVDSNRYIYDTTKYTTCENKPLKVSSPDIYLWHDNSSDTSKILTNSGNYWYLSKTNQPCLLKRTQLDIKINSNIYDTLEQTSCDSFSYRGTSYKNSGVYTSSYISVNGCDSFHSLDLKIYPSTITTLAQFSCTPYVWQDNIYSQSGSYIRKYKTVYQCDSILKLDISIGLDNSLKIENGVNYTSLQDNVSYQWYRCNPWRRITNETKKTFTTQTRGSYAVVLDNGKGCRDTSDCLELYSSQVSGVSGHQAWTVFPNPFKEVFHISLDRTYKTIHVKLYDLMGRLVITETIDHNSEFRIKNSELPKGAYYLQVETETTSQFFNLLKE